MGKYRRSIAFITVMVLMLSMAGCMYTVEEGSEERVVLDYTEESITIQSPAKCMLALRIHVEHSNGEKREIVKREIQIEAGDPLTMNAKELKTQDAKITSVEIIEQKMYNWWVIGLLILATGLAASWIPDVTWWLKKKVKKQQ